MRPKKRILLIDANEDRRGVLRFFLETHGFATLLAANAAEAHSRMENGHPELIVADASFSGIAALLKDLHRQDSFTPQLVLAPRKSVMPADLCGDAFLVGPLHMQELLERVKVMSARKRGPRCGFKKPVQPATPVSESARSVA